MWSCEEEEEGTRLCFDEKIKCTRKVAGSGFKYTAHAAVLEGSLLDLIALVRRSSQRDDLDLLVFGWEDRSRVNGHCPPKFNRFKEDK